MPLHLRTRGQDRPIFLFIHAALHFIACEGTIMVAIIMIISILKACLMCGSRPVENVCIQSNSTVLR